MTEAYVELLKTTYTQRIIFYKTTMSKHNHQADAVAEARSNKAAKDQSLMRAYQSINEDVQGNQSELVKPDSDGLVNVINSSNELLNQVKTANVGVSDSRLMTQISYLGKKKIQELKTSTSQFIPNEFAERVRTFLLQGECSLTADHWTQLGKATRPFFKYPPHSEFMLGTFVKESVPKAERIRKELVKDDNSRDRQTKVRQVVDDDENLESTANDVENRVLHALLHCYRHNEEQPVDYMEFVVDPDCFGTTIENMFHVSFLIRDGYAEISLDEDKLPTIKPTIYGKGLSLDKREEELKSLPRRQTISSVTVQMWKNIIETYKITKPRIPRRKIKAAKRK